MEKHTFVQRPGGLGPMADRVKPIGSPTTGKPSMYANTFEAIASRRASTVDDINRIYAQYKRDRGEYAREPIGPIGYGEGNILESSQLTEPAGYTHKDSLQLPMRAMDMNRAQYLVDTQNSMSPDMRAKLQIMTASPEQTFLKASDPTHAAYPQTYRMPDSLPLQLIQKAVPVKR